MTTDIETRAAALAAAITDVAAFTSPADAFANRPCILVAPPTIDYTGGTLDSGPLLLWRLVALSSYEAGNAAALAELMVLVDAAADAVDLDRATPTSYQLTADGKRVAAYLCTTTDYL